MPCRGGCLRLDAGLFAAHFDHGERAWKVQTSRLLVPGATLCSWFEEQLRDTAAGRCSPGETADQGLGALAGGKNLHRGKV